MKENQFALWKWTVVAILLLMYLFAWMGSTVYLEREVFGPKLWSECVLQQWDVSTAGVDDVQLSAIHCSDTASEALAKSVMVGAVSALMIVLLIVACILIGFMILLFFIDQHDLRELERKEKSHVR